MNAFIKQYKPALLFLVRFLVAYVILNVLYSWFFISYYPEPDPITVQLTAAVVKLVGFCGLQLQYMTHAHQPFVSLMHNTREILLIYEGCNGVNVWIVFVSFLIAYGPWGPRLWMFILLGSALLFIMAILRLIFLFWVVLEIPRQFYFFHKYLFSALLYLIVFIGWYLWIRSSVHILRAK